MAGKQPRVSEALSYAKYGNPLEVLHLEERKIDGPKEGEVLIKMLAAPVHPSDVLTLAGVYVDRPPLPAIGGNEGVGEVIECGSGVTGLQVGDRVFPFGQKGGFWQTHLCRSGQDVVKLDKRLPIEAAATIFLNPSTAYRLLVDFVKLKPGDVVIQDGATSAVGSYVIQLAKNMGIKTINLFRKRNSKEATEATRQELLSHGATWAITDDEMADTENSLTKEIKAHPAAKLGFECIGGDAASTIVKELEIGGTLVSYGSMTGKPMPISALDMIFRDIHVVGFWMVNWIKKSSAQDRAAMFGQLTEWFIQGSLKTSPFTKVPFKEWRKAIEVYAPNDKQQSSSKGKPILFMS